MAQLLDLPAWVRSGNTGAPMGWWPFCTKGWRLLPEGNWLVRADACPIAGLVAAAALCGGAGAGAEEEGSRGAKLIEMPDYTFRMLVTNPGRAVVEVWRRDNGRAADGAAD